MKKTVLRPLRPLRPLRIGIALGHGEQVNPGTAPWTQLGAILDSLPGERLSLPEPLDQAPLSAVDALLLGAPTTPLTAAERRALRRWVQQGGALLYLVAPDTPPDDLSALLPGLSAQDVRLTAPPPPPPPPSTAAAMAAVAAEAVLETGLWVDASALLGRPGRLWLEGGRALRASAFPEVRLDGRGGAGLIWPLGRGRLRLRAPVVVRQSLFTEGFGVALGPDPEEGAGEPTRLLWSRPLDQALLLLQVTEGKGSLLFWGGPLAARDAGLSAGDNLEGLLALLHLWLPDTFPREVARRLQEPQRHRLLQGYPMAPLLPPATALPDPAVSQRPLIVGVLPHPFCNPTVSGCGFCTFPHQPFQRADAAATAAATQAELEACLAAHPHLGERRLEGIYFGGGTANLTPAEALAALCDRLHSLWDTAGAEVTLEGVPRYFLHRDGQLLQVLVEHLPRVAQRRISMGVQTFDAARLAQMGRGLFGTPEEIGRVVEAAHGLGMTASGDLLFDLPGQTTAQMLADVQQAIGLGFDQICLYHLVLSAGMGTAWARDPAMLAQLPINPEGAESWLALRAALLTAGYTQTTLTNFERPPQFRYERSSFQPETYDALGFGPGGLSTLADRQQPLGGVTKWRSAEDAAAYRARVAARGWAPEQAFRYDDGDLRLLYLTRQLARLRIDRPAYQDRFGADVAEDFARPLAALHDAGLLETTPAAICPTPRGMFYADTIAGVLAWPRATAHRVRQILAADPVAAEAQSGRDTLDLGRYERAYSHGMG